MAVNLSALAGAGQQFFDNSGVILSGGKLYSYAAGTTTPQATYTSASGSTAHSNPIILNAAGRVATGEIWLTAGSNYKFALYTSTDVLITTWDNITGINGTGITSNASNVAYDPAGTGAVATNVQAKLRESVSLSDFCTGSGNEAAQIQNAVNAASGKILYININVSTASSINGISDIVIKGAGGSITNIDPSATTDISILVFNAKNNFIIDGVELIGSAKNIFKVDGTCSGIQTIDCTDFVITNCLITNQTLNGIYINASNGGTTQHGVISGNRLYDNGANAINPGTGTKGGGDISVIVDGTGVAKRFTITGNLCEGAGGNGIAAAPAASSTGTINGIAITGNHIQGKGQHGILLYPEQFLSDSEYAPADVSITGNSVANCNWMGIYAIGSVKNISVSGNNVTNCCLQPGSLTPGTPVTPTLPWGAISLSGAGTLGRANGVSITGNTVRLFNGYSGIYCANGDNYTITGNVIVGGATAAVAFNSNGITLQDMTYCVAADNVVKLSNAGGNGIYIDGEAAGGGGGGGVNPRWVGNSIAGNRVYGASVSGIHARVQDQFSIRGNMVASPTNYGIYVQDCSYGSIIENILLDTPNAYSGIFMSVTAAGDTTTNVTTSRNIFKSVQTSGSGIRINSAAVSDGIFEDNDFTGLTGLTFANKFLVSAWTRGQFLRQKYGLNELNGVFTFGAAATDATVTNANTSASAQRIIIFPYNAAAATLVGSAKCPYVSAVTAGTSFTVSTADGTAAVGGEFFGYLIL
jgi:parallel beta-helix repeat protein